MASIGTAGGANGAFGSKGSIRRRSVPAKQCERRLRSGPMARTAWISQSGAVHENLPRCPKILVCIRFKRYTRVSDADASPFPPCTPARERAPSTEHQAGHSPLALAADVYGLEIPDTGGNSDAPSGVMHGDSDSAPRTQPDGGSALSRSWKFLADAPMRGHTCTSRTLLCGRQSECYSTSD